MQPSPHPASTSRFRAKLVLVSPALDPNSTTVEIWVQCKNPKEVLRPGTSAQITMVARTVNDALAIPAASLLTAQDGTTSVMVAGSDGKAHQQTVKAGFRDGDNVQILEGLQVGRKNCRLPAPTACLITAKSPPPKRLSRQATDQKE